MQLLTHLNGTRIGTLLQTILYISGVSLFEDNASHDSFIRRHTTVFRNLEVVGPHPDDPLNTRCYGALGCITVKYPEQRGFHLFPEPLQDIMPRICLYTYNTSDNCQEVEQDGLNKLSLAHGEQSYWITHGYVENSHRPWIQTMKNELLQQGKDSNVFIIDWSRGSEPPYTQAVANLELVSAYTAHLMLLLQEVHAVRISHIHFIGHSLGAHFGGFIGSWLKKHAGQQISRISGLDPAQPYFQNYPEDARLDSSDAVLVDVIHTDAKTLLHGGSITGLGTQQPSGHIDFYPNNGRDQPGCKDGVYQSILEEDGSLISGLRRFIGCDHIRSYEYFSESIRSACSFTSYACSSWNEFISSSCDFSCEEDRSNCNQMGFHAKKPKYSKLDQRQEWIDGFNSTKLADNSILYYSITGSQAPYCRQNYEITVNLAGFSILRSVPDLQLDIFGPKRFNRVLNFGQRDLQRSSKFIIGVPSITLPIDKAVLKPSSHNSLWWLVNRITPTADIMLHSISILSLDKSVAIRLCPEGKSYFSFAERNPRITLTTRACTTITTQL